MGVWIETTSWGKTLYKLKSHPSWVCGLKHAVPLHKREEHKVTPFVGVWIETFSIFVLKSLPKSHPSWVCGLKQVEHDLIQSEQLSHPSWVCGLKLATHKVYLMVESHTLRGCVD